MYQFNKVENSEYCTFWGMNGGQPESPDGKRLVYARKKSLISGNFEVMVCDGDLKNHRKIFEASLSLEGCVHHNSVSATFIDNNRIVFRDHSEGLPAFRILNIDTGEEEHKIYAKESHCAENGKYPFSISPEFLGRNPGIDECGIYMLDVNTGSIEKAVSVEKIEELLEKENCHLKGSPANMSHVQLNPTATAVMMRLGIKESPIFGGLGCVDLITGETWLMRDKPVHQLWYDNDTYMATRQIYNGEIIEMESSYIARFSREGKELEILGGIANHIDGSFDRNFFAGDRCYPGYDPNIYLYKKGNKVPVAEFKIEARQDTVWSKQVHPNPTFSRDASRLYFNRPDMDGGTSAGYVEITEFTKGESNE